MSQRCGLGTPFAVDPRAAVARLPHRPAGAEATLSGKTVQP